MFGTWRGRSFPTGHIIDGVLEATGWYGKRFEGINDVHPLVFGSAGQLYNVNPRLLPMNQAERLSTVIKKPMVATISKLLLHCVTTSKPKARLRMVDYRGKCTATMLYDDLPIVDHFRQLDENTVLGVMDLRGSAPFFFTLERTVL
ncbi:DUF4334 domain-containing protein [Corynebacterium sp. 4HC-13]|uniref:DUF4334 domain-containing protein n=2 Tax=Corynebacterium anserum TaxID=2684406 RepID=A0A7G7YR64_9CORY|nr:DUF4334 domain-containing protein [Corynebacterium anserum]QNH96984.1 DUF4334 domain-containing protein [Corynebacterium anserum]